LTPSTAVLYCIHTNQREHKMTVRELMDTLAVMDPDLEVRIALVRPYVGEPVINCIEEHDDYVLLVNDDCA
jgi:hypothetical protein